MIAKEGVTAELWAEKWYDSEFIGGTWNLAYTTEKEVLSLIGDPGSGTFAEHGSRDNWRRPWHRDRGDRGDRGGMLVALRVFQTSVENDS